MIQFLKEETMDYKTFVNEITEMVKATMGKHYSATIYKVIKNNTLELDSLVLLKEGKKFAPTIYLEPYYKAYLEGTGIKELADRVCGIYQNCTNPMIDEKFNYTLTEMKSNIIYRLVNFEKNKKLLKKVPYIKYLDLAITFHCLVRNDEDGIGTIRITNEHMELWETTIQELLVLSTDNTKRLLPPSIRSMDEVIKGMLIDELGGENDTSPDVLIDRVIDNCNHTQHQTMYVLSNQKGINGASCLIYDNILTDFAVQINSDFYILPSSIHEVILVPYDRTITMEALTEMVKDVNRTQVADEEILSDRVYYYSRENKAITM